MKQFPAITGRNALPVLQAFVDFVKNDQVTIIGGPVREVRTEQGRAIIFEPDAKRFIGAFRVSTAGPKSFSIREGTVNGEVPILDGRDLGGYLPDGEPSPEGRPLLTVDKEPESRRSWICLQVAELPEEQKGGTGTANRLGSMGVLSGAQLSGEDPYLTVVHRTELPTDVPYGLDEEGRGLRPIAQLTWNDDRTRVDRVRQILHFDQEYRAPKGEDPRPEWRAVG